MVRVKIEESISLKEGEYSGIIKKNEVTTPEGKDYQYHDTYIEVLDTGYEEAPILRVGVPFKVTTKTLLGQMLEKFGADLSKIGEELDIEEHLKVGTKVKFSVINKKRDDAVFSNIIPNTLRPDA